MPETTTDKPTGTEGLDLPLEIFLLRKGIEDIANNIFDQTEVIAHLIGLLRDGELNHCTSCC